MTARPNLTYPEHGATAFPRLPDGYRHLRVRHRLGRAARFPAAAEALLTWRAHRYAGLRLPADTPRVTTGLRIAGRLGPAGFGFPVPCEVVAVVEQPDLAGFSYGTLPGHPECGEEAFTVEIDGDETWFTVIAFSRPAAWYTRLAGPAVPVAQRLYTARLAAGLRRHSDPRPRAT